MYIEIDNVNQVQRNTLYSWLFYKFIYLSQTKRVNKILFSSDCLCPQLTYFLAVQVGQYNRLIYPEEINYYQNTLTTNIAQQI